jgi:hypothetical protein
MNEFILLVKQMRQAQKEYFKTRSPEALQKSKQLERSVDQFLNHMQDNQQKLEL